MPINLVLILRCSTVHRKKSLSQCLITPKSLLVALCQEYVRRILFIKISKIFRFEKLFNCILELIRFLLKVKVRSLLKQDIRYF